MSIPRSFVIDPLIGTMKRWEESELDRGIVALSRSSSFTVKSELEECRIFGVSWDREQRVEAKKIFFRSVTCQIIASQNFNLRFEMLWIFSYNFVYINFIIIPRRRLNYKIDHVTRN